MGKKQHYIPRFILQYFTDKNGFIWCLDKRTGKVFSKRPEEIGYINHLYSVGDEQSEEIEEIFSKIEAKSAPIIKHIIEEKHFPECEMGRNALFYFLESLNVRYPELISVFNDQEKVMEVAEKELKADSTLSSAESTAFMDSFRGAIAENNKFYASNLEAGIDVEYKKLIKMFNIYLIVIEKGEFIISSEYKYSTIYKDNKGQPKGRDQLYYPLAPKICLMLSNKKFPVKPQIGNWGVIFVRDYQELEFFNRSIALKKEQFLFGSNKKVLDKAFAAACAFKKKQKAFKNLVNSLRGGISPFAIR